MDRTYRWMLYRTKEKLKDHGLMSQVAAPLVVAYNFALTEPVIHQSMRRLETWKKIIGL